MEIFNRKTFWAVASMALLIVFLILVQNLRSGVMFADDKVSIWVFDVGQGDSIFIDGPREQILIDGGPSGEVVEKLTSILPFWDREIDLMINTHPHADHLVGLVSVLSRYQIDVVWASGQNYDSGLYQFFKDQADFKFVGAGEKYDLGDGAILEIIWPENSLDGQIFEDPNDGSLVAILEYEGIKVLLTGDAGFEQEEFFKSIGDIDILKVGHHGSATATGTDFLSAVTPEVSVISVGADNDYGQPALSTLNRLQSFGTDVFRTDKNGDIRIIIDESGFSIHTYNL